MHIYLNFRLEFSLKSFQVIKKTCGPFKICVHVSSLRVIIQNGGLQQTMKNDRGLNKNMSKHHAIFIDDNTTIGSESEWPILLMTFRWTTNSDPTHMFFFC